MSSNPPSASNTTNAIPRFVTSILLTMHAKLRAISDAKTEGIVYTPPVDYFILQNGAKELYHQDLELSREVDAWVKCYSHLAPRGGIWKRPLVRGFGGGDRDGDEDGRPRRYLAREFPWDPLVEYVDNLDTDCPNSADFSPDSAFTPSERKKIYQRALTYITLIKSCITSGERPDFIQYRIAIAPSVFGARFSTLMQEGDGLSLVIVARVFALVRVVERGESAPWWLKGSAEYEILGLESCLEGKWEWALEWPFEVLESEDLLVREEYGGDWEMGY